ncbi:MAG: MFS transporter [Gemmatimonadetes bacterium]|nr:MFS transporter [Gemmatimonadota bacterium]
MRPGTLADYSILLALWFMMFAASSQTMIMTPLMPIVQTQFAVPSEYLGTLVTAYAVMLGICALITGPLSDAVGRRRILMVGTGAMCGTLFLHSFVTDYLSLLLVRAVSGMAAGVLSGVAPAYIGDHFPSERRGWANGVVMTAIAFGQIVGIPAGTILADRFDFATAFICFSIPMALSFVLVCTLVQQPVVARTRLSGIGSVVKRYTSMFTAPETAAAIGAYCVMFMGIAFYVIYLVVWTKEAFGVSGDEVASLFVVSGIASVIVGPWAGRLSDRCGRKVMIVGACLGLFLLMSLTTAIMTEFWIAYPLFFTIMLLVSARMGPFQALLSEIVPAERRGSLMSLSIATGQLAMGLCSAAAGIVYTEVGYVFSSAIGGAGMLVMAFIIWRYIPETRKA